MYNTSLGATTRKSQQRNSPHIPPIPSTRRRSLPTPTQILCVVAVAGVDPPASSVYSLDPDDTRAPESEREPDRCASGSSNKPTKPDDRNAHARPLPPALGAVANVALPPRLAIPGRRGVPAPPMDVSPPSSPDTLSSRRARTVSPDISPVDTLQEAPPFDLNDGRHAPRYVSSHIPRPAATPAQYMHAQRIPSYQSGLPRPPHQAPVPQANIGVARREKRRNEGNILHKATSRDRIRPLISAPIPQQTPPRWDSYTGDAAAAWQAKMANVKTEEHSSGFAQGLMRKIRQGGGAKVTTTRTMPIDERPEWKGGSGRTAIANPIRDQPGVAPPLQIPPARSMRMPPAGAGAPFAAPFAAPFSPSSPAETQSASAAPPLGHGFGSPLERENPAGVAAFPPPPPQRSSTAPATTVYAYYPTPPQSTSPRIINPLVPGASLTSHPWETRPAQPKPIRRKLPPGAAVAASSLSSSSSSSPSPSPPPPTTTIPTVVAPDEDATAAAQEYYSSDPVISSDSAAPRPDTSRHHHAPKPSYSSSVYSTYPEPRRTDPRPPEIPPTANVDPISPNLTIGPEDQWQNHSIAGELADDDSRTDQADSRSSSPLFDGYVPIPKAPPQIETPILDRKRPRIVREEDQPRNPTPEPIVISMHTSWRPSAAELNAAAAQANDSSSDELDHAADTVDVETESVLAEKALPMDPIEMLSGGNRVAQFNARLRALANRRINVTKSIRQMTELMPQDSLTASTEVMRKRDAEKKKIEVLREELADIQREEYELGLKLHRAYKRMDRESEYEPTGLWVRRATAA